MADPDPITDSQKWAISKLVIGLVIGMNALISFGGYFVVSSIADKSAQDVSKDVAARVAREVAERAAPFVSEENIVRRLSIEAQFLAKLSDRLSTLPNGTVIAVLGDMCPSPWRLFEAGAGRFLVGAGTAAHPLSSRRPGITGGEEAHILTLEEMPRHSHEVNVRSIDADPLSPRRHYLTMSPDAPVLTLQTAAAGGPQASELGSAKPHNTMPPFLSINFCIRDLAH